MIRLDHLAIPVRDRERSREWYATHFGFRVEFEVPERKTVALEDDAGLTLFLVESAEPPAPPFCTLRDPDGYLVYLWDERSMREKGD